MQKIIFFSLLPLLAIVIFVAAQNTTSAPAQLSQDIELDWPEDVMTIFESSCYGCHTEGNGSDKSRAALNFSKWEDYKLTKKVGKLNDISEMVKEKKMPPAKYLEKLPEKALSDEQIAVITKWANDVAEKLMGE